MNYTSLSSIYFPQIVSFLNGNSQSLNPPYCFSIEFVSVPEPYRILVKFLSQNSQKLLDRNLP